MSLVVGPNGTSTFDDVQQAIDEVGQFVTLRRLFGAAQIPLDVQTTAVCSKAAPQELVGGVIQIDQNIIMGPRDILARQWPGPPRKGDRIIIDGVPSTIESCEVVSVGTVIVRYNLTTRGGEV